MAISYQAPPATNAAAVVHDDLSKLGVGATLTGRQLVKGGVWSAGDGSFVGDARGGAVRNTAGITEAAFDAGASEYTLHARWFPPVVGSRGGVAVKYVDSANYIVVRGDEAGTRVSKFDAGVETILVSVAGTLVGTEVSRKIVVAGGEIIVYDGATGAFILHVSLSRTEALKYGDSTMVGISDIASSVPERYIVFRSLTVTDPVVLPLQSPVSRVRRTHSAIRAKLNAAANANVLVLGDSTSDETTEVWSLLADYVAARTPYGAGYALRTTNPWPALTVRDAAVPAINIYNSSTGSQGCQFMIDRFNDGSMLNGIPVPDAVFINLGFNDPVDKPGFRAIYKSLVSTIDTFIPGVPVLGLFQGGRDDGLPTQTHHRQTRYEILHAAQHDYADVWYAYGGISAEHAALYIALDDVHPNALGSKVAADTVWAALFPAGL